TEPAASHSRRHPLGDRVGLSFTPPDGASIDAWLVRSVAVSVFSSAEQQHRQRAGISAARAKRRFNVNIPNGLRGDHRRIADATAMMFFGCPGSIVPVGIIRRRVFFGGLTWVTTTHGAQDSQSCTDVLVGPRRDWRSWTSTGGTTGALQVTATEKIGS